jgi:hypothetical protein
VRFLITVLVDGALTGGGAAVAAIAGALATGYFHWSRAVGGFGRVDVARV